jgi:FixJ family two-component response regulator
VDDDEAVRESLSELLQVTGFGCRCFDSAEAFLADTSGADFDCIITDVRMPGIGGIELQERLRARGARTPVIFITSVLDRATRARALEAGAHAYLAKPIADDRLLAHLGAALDCDTPIPAGGEGDAPDA